MGGDRRKLRQHGKRAKGKGKSQFHVVQEWFNAGALGPISLSHAEDPSKYFVKPNLEFPTGSWGAPKAPMMEDGKEGGELSVCPEPQLQVSSGGHGSIGWGSSENVHLLHCVNSIPPENLETQSYLE